MSILSRMGQVTRIGYDNMIRARQRQAERYVARTLLAFDDETIARAGYSRKELEKRSLTY